MTVRTDKWTVIITQEELEQFIREKSGIEFPDVYIDEIETVQDGIEIILRPN